MEGEKGSFFWGDGLDDEVGVVLGEPVVGIEVKARGFVLDERGIGGEDFSGVEGDSGGIGGGG